MNNEKSLSEYLNISKNLKIEKHKKKIKIALLSSFTINGLSETLRVKCNESKINSLTYTSGYNQYNQEIINTNSDMYKFSPDVTFLIIDSRSILGNYFYSPYSLTLLERKNFIKAKILELTNLIQKFVKTSKSKLIISNFVIPNYSPFGIFETKTEYGLQEMILDLNLQLSDYIKKESSVFLYDFNGFSSKFGENNVFDFKQFYFGDIRISLDFIPHFSHELMSYIKPILGINKKCIVLDLDNTLWGGIIGEDGFNGIKLGSSPIGNAFIEFQQKLLALNKRGIILAVNSKNNYEDGIEVISNHPNMILREKNFACFKINWKDKVSNMIEISNELNIGLDSMVFFDDDPVNREFMRKSLPEVQTIDLPNDPSEYCSVLHSINDLNVLKITDEDEKRGQMYTQERKRTDMKNSSIDMSKFLNELDIKIQIKKADDFTIPRISQLTLKTNQFNLTTKRYQEETIRNFTKSKTMIVECVHVEDKFGDSGITGVYIIQESDNKEWYLDTFLMSCRIMGKEIEKGIIAYIIEKAKLEGIKKIKAQYMSTKKNKPCENFLSDCGFKIKDDYYIFDIENSIVKTPRHLTIIK
jgi:FkbH-like protein